MHDLSAIAQIDQLLNEEVVAGFIPVLSRPVVANIIRNQVNQYRETVRQQNVPVDHQYLLHMIVEALNYFRKQRLQRVINATGILVHTNLGRSPLAHAIWHEAEGVVCHYSNLEQNLSRGKRGNRMGLIPKLLQAMCGGESSLLVNNNAAAMHLLLRTLAEGKEVIVSRGEQVQIGGGFRIPELLQQTGAILRDVGTTNITTIDDYLSAINEHTAMVLIVHTSNYYIEGFTQHIDLKELSRCLPKDVLLVVDQGSGNQHDWLLGEKPVSYYLKAGADLVCFSADKMLGGPQGGIILGRSDLITLLEKHPMMRAFRPSKVIYALLETLLLHRLNHDESGTDRIEEIINQPEIWHRERAEFIASAAPDLTHVIPSTYLIGGGTTPREQYPTWVVELNGNLSSNGWLECLRQGCPAIMGVSHQEHARLYPVTLLEDDMPFVLDRMRQLQSELIQ